MSNLLRRWELPGRLTVACGPGQLEYLVGSRDPIWIVFDLARQEEVQIFGSAVMQMARCQRGSSAEDNLRCELGARDGVERLKLPCAELRRSGLGADAGLPAPP